MTLSARNRLQGKIVELQLGGVMAHVVVKVGDNLIESVITKRSADEMPENRRHGFCDHQIDRSHVGKRLDATDVIAPI
jgi:molybdopterin-binding protein